MLDVLEGMMVKPLAELTRRKEGGMVGSCLRIMRTAGNGRIGMRSGCRRRQGRRWSWWQRSSCRAERVRDSLAIGVVSATV